MSDSDEEFNDHAIMDEMIYGMDMSASKGIELAKSTVQTQIEKDSKVVYLESLDLQDLHFLIPYQWNQLEEIYLNRNMLNNIDVLQKNKNLKILDASNNYIEEVNLSLPKLVSLNLQNNYLKKFPTLENMHALRYLNLNSNQLVDLNEVNMDHTQNIKTLELEANLIEFDNVGQFFDFIDVLRQLLLLEQLNIDENPFFINSTQIFHGVNIRDRLINGLDNLKIFNGEQIKQVKKQIAIQKQIEEEEHDDKCGNSLHVMKTLRTKAVQEIKNNQRKFENQKYAIQPPPTLQRLLSNLEAANSHPSLAYDHIAALQLDVDQVVQKLSLIEEYFVKKIDPDESEDEWRDAVDDDIESFMQNISTLIDNHIDLQGTMLQILAKLCCIKYLDFGLRCFNTLIEQMKSSGDIETQVQNVLRIEVVSSMKPGDPTVMHVNLLRGLHELVEKTKLSCILSSLFDACFPDWLRLYCHKLDFFSLNKIEIGNNDHYDAILKLLSASVENSSQNIELFITKNLPPYVTKIMKLSSWQHERYIPILQMILRLSEVNTKAADAFYESRLHIILMEKLTGAIKQYLSGVNLYDGLQGKETMEQQRQKFLTLSWEVQALSGLLNCNYVYREEILNESLLLQIVKIIGMDWADPILLGAVCKFTLKLFQCDEIRYNEENMEPYYKALKNFEKLFQYLGRKKFPEMVLLAQKYEHTTVRHDRFHDDSAQLASNRILKKLLKEADNDDDGGQRQRDIVATMQLLCNDLVNELFISIINLVRYCCLEEQTNDQNSLFDQLSAHMNNMGRETVLFNCLIIPDDLVKLAVVQCIFVVPLDEFESDEISQLAKIISSTSNIGKGKTELIVAVIFWIFCKLVIGDIDVMEGCQVFQVKFGEKMLGEALNILQKNSSRVVEEDAEDMEKYALSISILCFIKNASYSQVVKDKFQNKNIIFKQILINEETYSTAKVLTTPIDIENTNLGREMSSLIDCIGGSESLTPYGNVSLRVMMRMADVLQFRHNYHNFQIGHRDDIHTALFDHQAKRYKIKKIQEIDFWVDMPDRFIEELDQEDREELIDQHYNFTNGNGVALLKLFLTTKFPKNIAFINALADPCFENNVKASDESEEKDFMDEIESKRVYLEQKFKNKYGKDSKQLKKKFKEEKIILTERSHRKSQVTEQPTNIQKFRLNFMREQLGYDHQINIEHDHQFGCRTYAEKERHVQRQAHVEVKRILNDPTQLNVNKYRRGEGFQNNELRSLTVAAFLRCLYGAVEYSPTPELRQNAIRNIGDIQTFRTITKICDCTNWDSNAHIGAKYLRVMRQVIKQFTSQRYEDMDMLVYYQIIGIVIQKVLQKVYDKIENHIQLTDGDQVTIYESSITFFTIIQQSNNFKFSESDVLKLHFQQEKSKTLKFNFKCEYEKDNENQSLDNFKVDIPLLKKKRSVQIKMVEYTIMKIFSKETVYKLIDVLFQDMKSDYELIEGKLGTFYEQDESDEGTKCASHEDKEEHVNDDAKDITRYGVDIDNYISIKGVLSVEIIKDIVGEIMSNCQKQMRYEILHKIMRSVQFDKSKIRQSFVQEILNTADDSTYRKEMQKYINEQMESPHAKEERIIEMCHADVNTTVVDKISFDDSQVVWDPNFVPRLIILTTHEIKVMKLIPQNLRCSKCPPSAFCPTGPYLDFSIEYKHVETVINFPQAPQKLVIKFRQDHLSKSGKFEGVLKYQMTINVPLYIKATRVYQNLLQIKRQDQNTKDLYAEYVLKSLGTTAISQSGSKSGRDKTKDKKKNKLIRVKLQQKYQVCYLDQMVQYELRMMMQQINPTIKKTHVHKCQIIIANLQKNTLVDKKFFAKNIANKYVKTEGLPTKKCSQNLNNFQEFIKNKFKYEESKNYIENQVYIAVIKDYILFLKEKWENWVFLEENENLISYKKKQLKTGFYSFKDKGKQITSLRTSGRGKEMIAFCGKINSQLFDLVSCFKVQLINKVFIHDGKDPSIEIKCFEDKHSLKILFTGDLERQQFIEKVNRIKNEDEISSSESEEEIQKDPDSSDDGEDMASQVSEEERVGALMYG